MVPYEQARNLTLKSSVSRAANGPAKPLASDWNRMVAPYAAPDARRSVFQLVNTAVPLVGIWIAMAVLVDNAYWATLLLSIPAAALVVRMFMIQHDCGHRSFFRSARLNDWVGHVIGVLTLTPHVYWRQAHNEHHATAGNLDKRGIGDVTTLTVDEYLALSPIKRFGYRVYRHPLTLLGIGPLYVFVLKFRLPLDLLLRKSRGRYALVLSVLLTNLAIAGLAVGIGFWLGFTEALMVQAPIIILSCAAGVWLFYIQHQYEGVYWRRGGDWNFHDAAIEGSSFYDLPQPLRWLTADIGIHHIHHLSSRIPNYRLMDCMKHLPELPGVTRLTMRDNFRCLRLALYDEAAGCMVKFSALRNRQAGG